MCCQAAAIELNLFLRKAQKTGIQTAFAESPA
jgi:hypothetical protein